MNSKFKFFALAICVFFSSFQAMASSILVPMDNEGQQNHLKAYGITYWALAKSYKVNWLLNYRGGSFLLPDGDDIRKECQIRGVSFEVLSDGATAAILEEIKSLLRENSAIDKSRSITVNLNELANTSLNLVVIAYTNTVNSSDFLMIQQTLFLQLLACIQRHGAEWSFPSHTIYLNNLEGIELPFSQDRNEP